MIFARTGKETASRILNVSKPLNQVLIYTAKLCMLSRSKHAILISSWLPCALHGEKIENF